MLNWSRKWVLWITRYGFILIAQNVFWIGIFSGGGAWVSTPIKKIFHRLSLRQIPATPSSLSNPYNLLLCHKQLSHSPLATVCSYVHRPQTYLNKSSQISQASHPRNITWRQMCRTLVIFPRVSSCTIWCTWEKLCHRWWDLWIYRRIVSRIDEELCKMFGV